MTSEKPTLLRVVSTCAASGWVAPAAQQLLQAQPWFLPGILPGILQES